MDYGDFKRRTDNSKIGEFDCLPVYFLWGRTLSALTDRFFGVACVLVWLTDVWVWLVC